jgi:hypothetical protein
MIFMNNLIIKTNRYLFNKFYFKELAKNKIILSLIIFENKSFINGLKDL